MKRGCVFSYNWRCTTITRMSDERQKDDLEETVKNAVAGYAMVVLGIVCFVLSLVVIAAIVRLAVSASAGVSV